ncbi:histidinol-phosphatase [uncultured Chryseobacterium sp.]|uniref:histidinol-phosphatase n=1 Tax=uncultured Chryseobacterium sp. TaxID=259322 RepID=UPI002586C54C|nr:histidinol-phosphatase [uncultured Chryseobacterium sp.]
MKKIDLHTHTISTVSDSDFTFDISKVIDYVEKLEIDALAITNHNVFDIKQYYQIKNSILIPVFPGIEIDLEGGHILVITDFDEFEVSNFEQKCNQVSDKIKTNTDFLTLDEFKSIFTELGKYILIPHYDKSPSIKAETIAALNPHITAGEVASIAKFRRLYKQDGELVPVLFSDMRFKSDLKDFSTRHTFFDLNDISLAGIKSCLNDKSKISLSKEDGNDFFQATDDGLKLSTGLNIILGERSSGKTVTLNKIASSSGNAKYIEQFSLLQNDEENFNKTNDHRLSIVYNRYLKEFKAVVEDILQIDLKRNHLNLEAYLESLKKYATESEKKDLYSKCLLFNESTFIDNDYTNLDKLIDSVIFLLENSEYQDIIVKYITTENLKKLLNELLEKAINSKVENEEKKWLNSIINEIQRELRIKTTSSFVENIDFYDLAIQEMKIAKFNEVVSEIINERIINEENLGKFSIITTTSKISGASDLQKIGRDKKAYSPAFSIYSKPYDYLLKLKEIGVEEATIYNYFIKIESETLNSDGFKVSGGERSEFNLIHEIKDATKFDILLIDEPESSFDNLFLKKEINSLIKDISLLMPVVVVTHNSTVGASIKPNFIAITQKNIENKEIVYRIFSGYPSDKELICSDGTRIRNYDTILNCLEAGVEAYTERQNQTYEILKN